MKGKYSLRMRSYYMLIVFFVVLFCVGTACGGLILLRYLGRVNSLSVPLLLSLLSVVLTSSILLSTFIGRRTVTPMVKLSNASKEVAKGNFNVTVSDSSKLEEVQTTFRNFNAMVRELNSTVALGNDFVANVSHEFKTPLTAISGYAELLRTPDLTQEEREEYLERIIGNTERLSVLIGNILALSKIESRSISEECATFRLDEQLRQTVVQAEPQWQKKELRLHAQLDAVQICGCEALLRQVWENLLGNAIKFSPQGGSITLRLLEQTECVVVSVSDEGCGMTPEVRAHIFEKFYQGDTSHRVEGNGLGLALVKRIVELSDGVIEVESEPEHGATFRVILPKK